MRTCLILIFAACVGCASKVSQPTYREIASSPKWAGAAASFSAHYVDRTSDGKHVKVILTNAVDDPCSELFADDTSSGSLDFWFLMLELPRAHAGTYALVEDEELGEDQARITINHVNGKEPNSRVAALAGRVVVDTPIFEPNATLHLSLSASFPERPVSTVECTGAASATESHHECTCQHSDGTRTRCEHDGTATTCCAGSEGGKTIALAVESQASFCPAMCSALLGLEQLCWK